MKGRIRGFFIPAGRERGAELVYTLPPSPLARTTLQRVSLVSGRPVVSALTIKKQHNFDQT
jgi:hypothetical protein